MCGIVALMQAEARGPLAGLIERMTTCVAHRGPDDAGQFVDGGIALGHRRLAIIDLSSAGHQPMATPSGRSTIVYNGELFNYLELREELRKTGRAFPTRSDTAAVL